MRYLRADQVLALNTKKSIANYNISSATPILDFLAVWVYDVWYSRYPTRKGEKAKMKAKEKLKAWKKFCHDQAALGYGFDAEGRRRLLPNDRRSEGLLAGYKLGLYKRRRGD